MKSKLYKKWLQTKNQQDENKYKDRTIFRKVAFEAQQLHVLYTVSRKV